MHRAQIENSTNVKYISILKNARITVGARLDFARYHRGITLIALIITVIVLLILAGVALNFIVGQNGILTHSETSKQKYELASAREELEMVIADIQTEILKTEGRKATLVDLENRIDKNKYSIILSTDPIATITAVSTNYTYASVVLLEKEIEFTVDAKLIIREVELVSVKQGTAEVEISTAIKEYVGKDENDKYRVKYEITLSTIQGVKSITVESGEEKQELTIDENLTKEVSVEIGKAYTITVTMEDGKYKRKTIYDRATETIKTAEELAQFRDKVNSGLSYEGKTVELANDINLSSVCGEDIGSWEPIGTTISFKGIFDGKYHDIYNLYINSNQYQYVGLFSNNNGTIRKLILKNVYINNYISKSDSCAGGITGKNNGTIENCGVNSGIISAYNQIGIRTYAGGITGTVENNKSIVKNCYNKAKISSESIYNSTSNQVFAGGIIGGDGGIGLLENCYNFGSISAKSYHEVKSGGIIGRVYQNFGGQEQSTIKNTYNVGMVYAISSTGTSTRYVTIGGILGHDGWDTTTCGNIITNTYYKENTAEYSYYKGNWSNPTGIATGKVSETTLQSYATTLGSAYTNDVKIKVKDETTGEEKEIWKYNNGYPILKWQLPENQK